MPELALELGGFEDLLAGAGLQRGFGSFWVMTVGAETWRLESPVALEFRVTRVGRSGESMGDSWATGASFP